MRLLSLFLVVFFLWGCSHFSSEKKIVLPENARIALIGNNLCSRMMSYGTFETEMHVNFPDQNLYIRNMCDAGNTPGFRPHSARNEPWAFPGAERFYLNEFNNPGRSVGDFPTEDEWLKEIAPDVILAFFGYNESFRGEEGLDNYKDELKAFIDHTSSQIYKGDSASELVLISPLFYENKSDVMDVPDGNEINARLGEYVTAMKEVAHLKQVRFVDLYTPSKSWKDYTEDGFQVNEAGYKQVVDVLIDALFSGSQPLESVREEVHKIVQDKNWFWSNDFKVPNGVHVYGRRHEPFGVDNYPAEIEKMKQLTANRDTAIWMAARGLEANLSEMDSRTRKLPQIETNYNPDNIEDQSYKYGDDYLETFTMAPGYKVDLFASEKEFPDLANPVQLTFDDRGRLWVAVMPSYPHYKPGDSRPDDKLIILEDTDQDGKADKQTIFADSLHLPVGFEITHEGVYISQGSHLKLLIDSDGDDHADQNKIILSGFDDHDTHHTTSAFCADPSGAIFMGEGVFLHTSVETAYGPVRSVNGGFWRFDPRTKKLLRIASPSIPNPWGTAFDTYGQSFFIRTSSPHAHWLRPTTVKQRYGINVPLTEDLIPSEHKVRPTSGLEFVSSRHFPDAVQGDMLLNNTIGFLGTKQHEISDDGTGYKLSFVHDLIKSNDGNFRPVDLEFAPDGSLYMVDWHNILVGHMQHNARDPLRDHVHGRILRITYPDRPLVQPAKIHDASIEELFENLKLPEYRTRYRTRRALRGREQAKVLAHLAKWKAQQQDDHALLEGLWVSWGVGEVDQALLKQLLNSADFRIRSAAVNVLRYNVDKISDYKKLLETAARDEHGRVRLHALIAATWLRAIDGEDILQVVESSGVDNWMEAALKYGRSHMKNENYEPVKSEEEVLTSLKGDNRASFVRGKAIYAQEGSCKTCHQEDGKGLIASGFPPLLNSEWVNKSDEVLIRITLKGLLGPIKVAGRSYPGQVPMPGYEKMLSDQEISDVLTYVKQAFGDGSSVIKPEEVKYQREGASDQTTYYKPEELLRIFPIQ